MLNTKEIKMYQDRILACVNAPKKLSELLKTIGELDNIDGTAKNTTLNLDKVLIPLIGKDANFKGASVSDEKCIKIYTALIS